MAMNEDTVLEDFKRYQEVCERENRILLKSIKGETIDAIRRNQKLAQKGGRPKGIPAWNKGLKTTS